MFDNMLAEVLCETAEQIFFTEFEDQPAAQLPERVFWATIAVRSPSRFEVVVAADEAEMRCAIETLFMGAEPTDFRVSDVIAELANTVAGTLSRHLSDEAHLDLSTPEKGLGIAPLAERYHAFSGEELTLFVAVRGLDEAA
jgi:hypothetical protein